MQNKNINIKSIDELRRSAISGQDITHHVKTLVRSIETSIMQAIRMREDKLIVQIPYGIYNFECFSAISSVKIMAFNIIQILEHNGYSVNLRDINNDYHIIIDLTKYGGKGIDDMLDQYLNKYK